MDFLTILSIASLITTVIGLWCLGLKDKNGFIIFDVSLLCQMFIFYEQKNYFLMFQMVVLITFNTINFFKWKREESNEQRANINGTNVY